MKAVLDEDLKDTDEREDRERERESEDNRNQDEDPQEAGVHELRRV